MTIVKEEKITVTPMGLISHLVSGFTNTKLNPNRNFYRSVLRDNDTINIIDTKDKELELVNENNKSESDSIEEDKEKLITFEEMYNKLVAKFGYKIQLKQCCRSIDFENKAIYVDLGDGKTITVSPLTTDSVNICIGKTSTLCYCPSCSHIVRKMNIDTLNFIINIINNEISLLHNNKPMNDDKFDLNNLVVPNENNMVELNVEVMSSESENYENDVLV